MFVKDFDFYLPEGLIAQQPLADRSASRLMLVHKQHGYQAESTFASIGDWLRPGDLLVLNDSKVIPARLIGNKKDSGSIELLLLKQESETIWHALGKPGRRTRLGCDLEFASGRLHAKVIEIIEEGIRRVEFSWSEELSFLALLDDIGEMPLPPYIQDKLTEQDRYQTVYANAPGSAAAPTAGLHFTQELLDELEQKKIDICKVTLQIGLGTFRPVKVETVAEHVMHTEHYYLTTEAADQINKAKAEGRRVIAVGTTACRVLESAVDSCGQVVPGHADTDIFITPGYRFRILDGLITNFHLPKSTLLMLVAALTDRETILSCYQKAVEEQYRFFSFGDAMFIADHFIK